MKKICLFIALLGGSFNLHAVDLIPANIVAAHNIVRAKVGVPNLVWSNKLTTQAQAWANELKNTGCPLKHSNVSDLGENIYWASSGKIATDTDANGEWIWIDIVQGVSEQQVVDSWANEQQWYSIATNTCNAPAGKSCGHYTQVVWGNSTEVGCAKTICEDYAQIWVCNYAPAGNMNAKKPY